MEPDLRKKYTPLKSRTFYILTGILLGMLILFWIYYKSGKEKITYKKVTAVKGDIRIKVRTSGSINPRNRLEIKPPVAGRIEEILVEEGIFVPRGKILAWMSSTERAALLDAARAKGKREIKEWENVYRPTPVIAPLEGTVIAKNLKPGQTVTQQDILFVLSDTLIVLALVDETDIRKIKLGQKANVMIDSFPDKSITAKVSHIAYEAIIENSVTIYKIEVDPIDKPEFLRSGMSATVDFILEERENTIILPNKAIYSDTENSFYVLKKRKKKMTKFPVKIGIQNDSYTEILSGVKLGEMIFIKQKIKDKKKKSKNPFFSSGRKRKSK